MIIKYTTKRDRNGNRYYIAIDHSRREYATAPHGIIYRADAIQVTAGDLHKLEAAAAAAGYKRIETL